MTDAFRAIKPEELVQNPFQAIGKGWMLVTAANGSSANPMTASWGGVGILWNKPVAYVFLRPQRFTRELVDAADTLSLSFLPERYREQLRLCGTKSGRDIDKITACGFTVLRDGDTPYIGEADTAFLCRKLYRQRLEGKLLIDPTIDGSMYPENDHHYLYIVEITDVLVKETK